MGYSPQMRLKGKKTPNRISKFLNDSCKHQSCQPLTDGWSCQLRGEASSQAQRELTTEYAKDVEGVKEVKNEMTIAKNPAKSDETIGEKIDDASITAQVKSSLMSHRSTSALKTKVETTDGVVTLSGKARNAAEKSLVTKLVTDINGVKSVINNMTVEAVVSKANPPILPVQNLRIAQQ